MWQHHCLLSLTLACLPRRSWKRATSPHSLSRRCFLSPFTPVMFIQSHLQISCVVVCHVIGPQYNLYGESQPFLPTLLE